MWIITEYVSCASCIPVCMANTVLLCQTGKAVAKGTIICWQIGATSCALSPCVISFIVDLLIEVDEFGGSRTT